MSCDFVDAFTRAVAMTIRAAHSVGDASTLLYHSGDDWSKVPVPKLFSIYVIRFPHFPCLPAVEGAVGHPIFDFAANFLDFLRFSASRAPMPCA